MKQIDIRDVPNEQWERVDPFLETFKRKRNGEVHLFPSEPFLSESFANARGM